MRERLKVRLYLLGHGLMARWMLITCLIILPVLIFSMMSVYSMSITTIERMEEQLQNQLARFKQGHENAHQSLQTAIVSEVLAEQMYALSNCDASDSVLTDVRLKNALSQLSFGVPGYKACFLYDRNRDFISFFNKSNRLNENLKTASLESVRSLTEMPENGMHILHTIDRAYLFIDYVFPYYSFGYVLDAEEMLQACYQSGAQDMGTVILSDQNGTVHAAYPHVVNEVPAASKGILSHGIAVHSDLDSLSLRLTYYVSPTEARQLYPVINTIFQILSLLSILVIPLLYLLAKRLINRPLTALWEGMQQVEAGDLDYRVPEQFGTVQMDYLAKRFNQMTGEIRHMRIASYEQEIGKLQTETINAHLQVNQHMLMNSLNVVYSLIQMKRYDEAGEFTVLLMKYFQYALRKNSNFVTVQEEMTFIEDYIRLQKIRFKNRFTSVCQVTEEARDKIIPQLLVQGFVENAVKYAIVPDRITEILIDIHLKDERLLISVIDSGNGIEASRLSMLQEGKPVQDATGMHVGLWNVRKRLDYYYGSDYELKIVSDRGTGTMVHVSLPFRPKGMEQKITEMGNETALETEQEEKA